jgi:hypothetical protein
MRTATDNAPHPISKPAADNASRSNHITLRHVLDRWLHDFTTNLIFAKFTARTPMTETFLVFKVLVACVISSLIQSKASSFCLISHRNTSPNQESGDQISISIMLILAIEALNDGIGISSTNTKSLFTPPPHTRPSNMTVVSNDSDLLYSYSMGSSY